MKIYVSQIYIEPGASYPFSHKFQKQLSEKLSEVVPLSVEFQTRFGEEYDLIFRMSAKSTLVEPEIKGPTVFKRDKDVEFTVFLPFDRSEPDSCKNFENGLRQFLGCVKRILEEVGLSTSALEKDLEQIVSSIVSDKEMFIACDCSKT